MEEYISRQAAIDALNDEFTVIGKTNAIVVQDYIRRVNNRLHNLPSAQQEIIRCKDCRWWGYEDDDGAVRVCHAAKHGHMSPHWDIQIYRTYKGDFYCADAERKVYE